MALAGHLEGGWCQCRALHRTTATGNNSQLSDSTMGGSLAYSTAIRTVNWSHKCNKQMVVVVVVGAALHGKQDEGEQQARQTYNGVQLGLGSIVDIVKVAAVPHRRVDTWRNATDPLHIQRGLLQGVSQRSAQRGTTV